MLAQPKLGSLIPTTFGQCRGFLTTASLDQNRTCWKQNEKYTIRPIGMKKTGGRDYTGRSSLSCFFQHTIVLWLCFWLSFRSVSLRKDSDAWHRRRPQAKIPNDWLSEAELWIGQRGSALRREGGGSAIRPVQVRSASKHGRFLSEDPEQPIWSS